MGFRNTFTQNVYISFEKARKIRYNANDLSLFDDSGKPKDYGQDFSPRPKQLPGQERPNHKYIERKSDPKNPGRYIYIYERPDGTRYEEQEPEQVHSVRPFTEDDFKPKEPSLFDQPEDTPKKPFLHLPEGPFSPSKAKEFAEKNKHLIGNGITYKALIDPEVNDDDYDYIVHMIQALAHTGNETTIPYEEVEKKAAQYDLSAIDEDGKLRKLLQPDRYMPVSGPFLLKQMNSLQIKYDKKHPAAPKPLVDTTPEPGEKKDLDTQVQELLDAKQKNKQFKDLNERVSGSRKEAAAIKKLQAEDILKLDNATQYERINKKLVMPEYDPHAAKESGTKAGVVYMNMKIRDSIAAKPVNSATARQIYVKFMPALLEELENAPTLDDMKGVFRKYFDTYYTGYGHRTKKEVLFTQGAMDKFKELGIELPSENLNELKTPPEAVLGKIFCGLVGQTTDTAKDHWSYAKKVSGITDHEIEKSKTEWIERLKAGYEAAYNASDEKVDKMGPHELGNELHKYKVVTDDKLDMDKRSIKFWKLEYPDDELNKIMGELKMKRRAGILQEMEDDKAIEAKATQLAKQNGEPRPNNWEFLPAKEEAADGTAPEAKIDKKKVSDTIKQFPKLLRIIRTNGREVTDEEVTVENLHDLFGYKSVQLGNWVKDHEAKEHIKHFIASMKDMEDALGIDLKKMNETAGLSIAFGARGRSNALAHYEPMRKIINLTKTKGDGTIAHEWGHFFDHYLGGAEGDKLEEEGYASVKKAVHFEIREIVDELVKEIKTGRVMKTETFQPPEVTPKAQYRVFNFVMNSSRIPDEERESRLIDEARTLMQRYPDKEREIGELAAYAAKKPLKIEFEGLNHFYSNSMKQKNKKYWANNQELFARAWEAYVEDKLAENGLHNNYLVSGSKIGTGDRSNEALSVYPQGEFRGRLNKIFDRLIDTTKRVYGVEKPRDTETKRINEVIDYTGNEGDENLFDKSIVTITEADRKAVNQKLTYKLTKMLKRGRGSLKFTVSNLLSSVNTAKEEEKEYPTYGEIDFHGLKIVVENKPGTVRRGTDPDGEKWKTKMFYPYGYIKGTKATDGEGVDVYVGKNRDSQKVFIIHQKDIGTKKYDEDKVMLGFETKESARDAYLAHYDTYEFLGEITEMSIDEFREKLKTRKGKIIKSESFLSRLLKAFRRETKTPDWQLEFDFGDYDEQTPQQGATNDRGETLLPSKANPKVNRWQRHTIQNEEPKPTEKEVAKEANEHPGTFQKIQEGEIKTPEELGEAIAEDHANSISEPEPHKLTFEEYAAQEWTTEEEGRIKEYIEQTKRELKWVTEGRISPRKIVGTGLKNPKAAAIDFLNRQIAENELALKNKYTYITLHNYKHDVKRALMDGKEIPLATQESYSRVMGELKNRHSESWGLYGDEKYEDFATLKKRLEASGLIQKQSE